MEVSLRRWLRRLQIHTFAYVLHSRPASLEGAHPFVFTAEASALAVNTKSTWHIQETPT
jgi:hypothetical protein